MHLLYDGYEARVHPRDLARWDEERRRQYLLRPDVTVPLSVDPNIWPRYVAPGEPAIRSRVPWMELEDVTQVVPVLERESCVLVAVAVLAADDVERQRLATTAGIEREIEVGADWTFLGYDVADGDISGLCNCGYREEDTLFVARDMWAARLGENGLFIDREHALEFRRLTDLRVAEHAPFFVKALWMVPWPA